MVVPQRDGSGGRPPNPPAFNNMPGAVVLLLVAITVITLIDWITRQMGMMLIAYGAVFTFDAGQPLGRWAPYLLHVFFHGSTLHLMLNGAALLAFGAASARPFPSGMAGQAGFLVFFFACSAAGAAFHVLTHPGDPSPMIGASTGLSGCIAAAGYRMGGVRGLIRLGGPWLAINIGIAFAGGFIPLNIAWAAHIGGLVAGAALYPVFGLLFSFNPTGNRSGAPH